MLDRLLSRLLEPVTLLVIGLGLLTSVAMVGVLGYAALNPSTVASPSKPMAAASPESLTETGAEGSSADAVAVSGPTAPSAGSDIYEGPPQLPPPPANPVAVPVETRETDPPADLLLAGTVATSEPPTPTAEVPTRSPTATVVLPPPSMPHPAQGREQCTACHVVGASGAGVRGGAGIPASHQGRTDGTCRSCHAAGTASTAPAASSATPEVEEPMAVSDAPTGAEATGAEPVSEPPSLPHTTQGRESCTTCHTVGAPGIGAAGGTGLPSTHQGRTSETCLGCHTASASASAETVPAGTTPSPTAASTAVSGPPALPHTTAGRTQCTSCHTTGGQGVGVRGGTGLPGTHQGRTDGSCLGCHTVSASVSSAVSKKAPRIEHSLAGRTQCTNCHVPKGTKAPKGGEEMPRDHQGRTSEVCLSCHRE